MTYTGRIDDVKIESSGDTVSISKTEPGWGGANERPVVNTVTFNKKSINNLIEALRDIQTQDRNRW